MKFKLLKYSDFYKNQWNSFIHKAKNGLFFFDRSFMEYHKDRFIDHSLIFLKGEEIIGVFPASEKDRVITSHGGLTFGSLIISHTVKTTEVLFMFDYMKNYYKSAGFTEIIYKTIPHIFSPYPSQEDLYALFRSNAKLIRRDVSSVISILDRIKFSETKRQLVNKCKNNNVLVTETDNFNSYWVLLESVLQKFGAAPVHSLAEIKLLQTRFPENIRLFQAVDGDHLLAGIVIFDFGKTVHTQYMAASDIGRKVGALDFINNYLLEEVYNDRNYYSFGISTEDSGNYLNEGLIQQKENMGGRAVTLDFYKIELNITTND